MKETPRLDSPEPPSSSNPVPKIPSKPRRPWPWPFGLAAVTLLGAISAFAWIWSQEDYILFLRALWVGICSLLPGIALMIILGSLIQMKRRPFLSFLSFFTGSAILAGCIWLAQKIAEKSQWLAP